MNRESRNYSRFFLPRTGVYLCSMVLLSIVITLLNWRVAIPAYVLALVLIFHNHLINNHRRKELSKYIENLNFNISTASKDTMLNFPMPLTVLELDGTIIWYNSLFRSIFENHQVLAESVATLADSLKTDGTLKVEENISRQLSINGRDYHVLGNYVKTDTLKSQGGYILLLYYIEQTELTAIKTRYIDEKAITAIIVIDNYDDLMQSMEDPMRPQMLAEIDRKMVQWFSFTSGILKKFERDKYILVFEHKYLKSLEECRFEILDQVKEISIGNRIPVTLSIGLGLNVGTFADNFQAAANGIDIALGRGGDQVVIKNGQNYSFYGGKTRELEKRTKVKARVIAHALRDLIDNSSSVVIMGHENSDIDCFGASLGFFRMSRNRDRQAFIIRNQINPTVTVFADKVDRDPEYKGVFISNNEAAGKIDENTLLVIVDTHRASFTEFPELVAMASRVVVVDHHRRGTDFIQDAVLNYQETYASSTCELVAEILQYIDEKPRLKQIEVEALYAGILVDTRNFTLKAGVRTFEAASFLKRQGVDIIAVRQMMQDDMQTYRFISDIVRSAEIVNGNIAISICPSATGNPFVISAKAADELLDLQGIMASFVLCEVGEGIVNISGRSMGDMNVQVILEKLGGGGHLTGAGAQIPGVGLESAKEKLKYAIIEYIDSSKKD